MCVHDDVLNKQKSTATEETIQYCSLWKDSIGEFDKFYTTSSTLNNFYFLLNLKCIVLVCFLTDWFSIIIFTHLKLTVFKII